MQVKPRVRIVGASSPFDPHKLEAGVERLRNCGFDVDDRDALQGRHAYLNGDDLTRARMLQEALHSDVDIVWLARGGYGLTRIAATITLPKRLPLLIGFSDVTALFARLHNEGRLERGIHGPLATSVALEPDDSVAHLVDVVRGGPGLPLPALSVLCGADVGGGDSIVDVEGPLFAANLCVLASMCGTSLQPQLSGHVLVLEEVAERPYRLDRMMTQLLHSGVFKGVKAVVIGHLSSCAETSSTSTSSAVPARDPAPTPLAVFGERLQQLRIPVVAGLAVGHEAPNRALPLGSVCRLRLTGDTATLTLRPR